MVPPCSREQETINQWFLVKGDDAMMSCQRLSLPAGKCYLLIAAGLLVLGRNKPVQLPDVDGKIKVTSTAFKNEETIPKIHTADGKEVSPPLQWTGEPKDTKSFVLICHDPDAPGKTWFHWVIFNLPPDVHEMKEGIPHGKYGPSGATQVKNDSGDIGYGGPGPPPGKPHRYYFTIYALDKRLDLHEGATKEQVLAALKGHVLAGGQLMGKYGR
jgi:Raf kinase inhibitor-like YbhB/YbcL family protein